MPQKRIPLLQPIEAQVVAGIDDSTERHSPRLRPSRRPRSPVRLRARRRPPGLGARSAPSPPRAIAAAAPAGPWRPPRRRSAAPSRPRGAPARRPRPKRAAAIRRRTPRLANARRRAAASHGSNPRARGPYARRLAAGGHRSVLPVRVVAGRQLVRLTGRAGGSQGFLAAPEPLVGQDPPVAKGEQGGVGLIDLDPLQATAQAADNCHLVTCLDQLLRLDRELLPRREEVRPELTDPS